MKPKEMLYIAHPIDLTGEADAGLLGLLKERVRLQTDHWNLTTYWPGQPFGSPQSAKGSVYRVNEAALAASSGVLAILPPGVPSVGVPMEIQTARDRCCPVVALGGERSVNLRALDVKTYPPEPRNVEAAVAWVMKNMREHPPGAKLKWLGQEECCPQRFHPGDAGFDLVVARPTEIPPGEFVDVDCGIKVELPEGVWAMITGRSSTLRKRRLLVAQGIIDQGYRGPLYAGVWNLGTEPNHVVRGERLAQLIPFPLTASRLRLQQVAELSESSRGEAGFGSTGVWAS